MKWKDIKTPEGICFDMDNWKDIIKKIGELEDEYDVEISRSDFIDVLTRFALKNMKDRHYLEHLCP